MPSKYRKIEGLKVPTREPQVYCHSLFRPRYPIFIAEIGSNHCGSIERATDLITAAADAGAQAVKFQLFRWVDILRKPENVDPRFELPLDWIPTLHTHAHQRDMAFLCTPFAPWAIPPLAGYVDGWKIGSYEALYTDLLFALPDDRKPLWLSTGMVWDRNIARLMGFLRTPGLILTHCVSKYPTSYKDAGLDRINRFKKRGFRVGYSSHTVGWTDVIVAASIAPLVSVEKHIRFKDQPDSPDNGPWALSPSQFRTMIKETRDAVDARLSRYVRPPIAEGRRIFGA